jgi:hypothetical protein
MQIGGPETAALVFRASYGAEVSGEGVEPNVEDVGLFAGDRDAPADGGARDAEIAQAAFDEG